jgi:hypothetical protein
MKYVLAFVIGFLLMATIPAPAAQRITFNPGGGIIEFVERFERWRVEGELVVIDGMCISACTFALGLIPPDRLCTTPYARLAFHSATSGNRFNREWSRIAWMIYPPPVREYLLRRGWQKGMEHYELIFVEGADMDAMVRPCDARDMAELAEKKFGPKQ